MKTVVIGRHELSEAADLFERENGRYPKTIRMHPSAAVSVGEWFRSGSRGGDPVTDGEQVMGFTARVSSDVPEFPGFLFG